MRECLDVALCAARRSSARPKRPAFAPPSISTWKRASYTRGDEALASLTHMLEQLSRHSLMDLEVEAKGDLHIDFHHTTEDVGDLHWRGRIGARRWASAPASRALYGNAALIPMDETLTQVAIDLFEPPLPDLESRAVQAEALGENGHGAVQGMVPGLRPGWLLARPCTYGITTARTTTTSSNPASKASRAPCVRRSRSIPARPTPFPPPRAVLGGSL